MSKFQLFGLQGNIVDGSSRAKSGDNLGAGATYRQGAGKNCPLEMAVSLPKTLGSRQSNAKGPSSGRIW